MPARALAERATAAAPPQGTELPALSLRLSCSLPGAHLRLDVLDAGRHGRPVVATAHGTDGAVLHWLPPQAPGAAGSAEAAAQQLEAEGGQPPAHAEAPVGPYVLHASLDVLRWQPPAELESEVPRINPDLPGDYVPAAGAAADAEEQPARVPAQWQLRVVSGGGVSVTPDRTADMVYQRMCDAWEAAEPVSAAHAGRALAASAPARLNAATALRRAAPSVQRSGCSSCGQAATRRLTSAATPPRRRLQGRVRGPGRART